METWVKALSSVAPCQCMILPRCSALNGFIRLPGSYEADQAADEQPGFDIVVVSFAPGARTYLLHEFRVKDPSSWMRDIRIARGDNLTHQQEDIHAVAPPCYTPLR